MADNVPITAGSGTSIATDDISTVHYQLVKLAYGPLNTATLVEATVGLPVTLTDGPSTSAVTQVASSASNVTLKASNAARLGLKIYNDSTAVLYVKFGATASTTSYTVQMGPQAFYVLERPPYTGIVDGIWAAANGNAYVTELTA